jgi:glycerophosphoryl diester phosphodiesterase
VHPYTFGNESPEYIVYSLTASARDEYALFFKEMGIDRAFTDSPATMIDHFKQSWKDTNGDVIKGLERVCKT